MPEVREAGFVLLPEHANARGCLLVKMKEVCQLAKNGGVLILIRQLMRLTSLASSL